MALVFVFGSNEAGRHGKGAALQAQRNWGAQRGEGRGRVGNSYAIPTKDENLCVRSLEAIRQDVRTFLRYAFEHPTDTFWVTAIGTGLAGYSHEEIAPMFRGGTRNLILPDKWNEILSIGCGDDL